MRDTCSNCGKKVDKDFKFCPFCFQDFTASEDELKEIDDIESIKDEEEAEAPAEEAEAEPEAEEETEEEEKPDGLLIAEKFLILEPLHSSAHGTVCKSELYRRPGRVFILRDFIIEERDADRKQELIDSFFSVAERFLGIQHYNLAPLLECTTENNYLYLVYAFTEGKFIDKIYQDFELKRGEPIPEKLIVRWGAELADLLSFLHHSDPEPIYCGDLKPYSLMIRKEDSSIVFIHLGLVYFYEVLGIQHIYEPELATVDREYLSSPFYDLFCLGNILYFLATGIDIACGEAYVPLRELRPDLSPELLNIIESLMTILDEQTFESTDDVLDALNRLIPEGAGEISLDQEAAEANEVAGEETEPAEKEETLTWHHFLGNVRRTNSYGSGPEHPLRVKWMLTIPQCTQNFLVPHHSALVSLTDKGNICTIDTAEGRFRKKENLNINPVAPIIVDDQICICSSSTQISISIDDLSKKWDFRTKSMILCSPNYINNNLCYISYDGFLIFVDPETGKALTMENLNAKVISSPVFDESRLYIPTLMGTLMAIDHSERTIVWQQNTRSSITGAPSYSSETIFCGNNKGNLFAFSAATGDIKWEKALKGTISQSIRIAGDRIFAHNLNGEFTALNAADGSILWTASVTPHYETPYAVTDSYIYLVNGDNCLIVIDTQQGSVLSRLMLPDRPNCTPLVVNDSLYISLKNGNLLALGKDF
jgi:outer membrane protein assembly factor BamB/RNA polymerase subunit RPABC4/transcription elongation factor Spt4